jgi:peptidoglycan hydrolase-like protein with peptidoglycan-binding domain
MVATPCSFSPRRAAIPGVLALLLLTGAVQAQTPAPACKKALADATARWPKRNKASDGIMGDEAHKKTKSDHNDGNAFDLTHDPANGVDCNVLSLQVIKDPRVTYVIWNRQIYNRAKASEGWRKYTGKNPHTKHMHVSIKATSRNDLSAWPWSPAGGKGGATPFPGTNLKKGSKGDSVTKVQQRLQELGYNIGTKKPDGDFGGGTDKAVRKFQGDRKLKADGIVGATTWAALFAGKPGAPPATPPATPPSTTGQLAWGQKVSLDFRKEVVKIATDLGVGPSDLMACMAFESAQTFKPDIVNKSSGATGLIQCMPSTAKNLGTTTDALKKMTAVEQLAYVAKYFKPHKGKLKNIDDLYMAILWPLGVGKAGDYVLWVKDDAKTGKAYKLNSGLDSNKDGKVTKDEAAGKVRAMLTKGLKPDLASPMPK